MATLFLIAGLIVTLVGVVLILTARIAPASTAESFNPVDVLKELNKLLSLVEKKYRIGIVVIATGLSLIGVGVFLEAKAAKDEAKKTSAPLVSLRAGHTSVT
jgi:uncharacterized membrane protein